MGYKKVFWRCTDASRARILDAGLASLVSEMWFQAEWSSVLIKPNVRF